VASRIDFLGKQPKVVGEGEELLEYRLRFFSKAGASHGFYQPKGTRCEICFSPDQAVIGRRANLVA
jgi:hypothetical protein